MRFFGWFCLLVGFWILFELSFLELLFPDVVAPLFLLALVIALVAVLDFPRGFWWSVGSSITFDLLRSGELTLLTVWMVVLAYVTSFLSRRLTFGGGHTSRLLLTLLMVVAVAVYGSISPFFTWPRFLDMLIAIPVFLIVLASVHKLDTWLAFTSLSEFRGLRHS